MQQIYNLENVRNDAIKKKLFKQFIIKNNAIIKEEFTRLSNRQNLTLKEKMNKFQQKKLRYYELLLLLLP